MKHKIEQILFNGKSSNAGGEDESEMMALFHQPEKEFELKNALLEDLEKVELTEDTSKDFGVMFAKLWERLEQKPENNNNKKYFIAILKVAAVLTVGLFLGFLINNVVNETNPVYYQAHSPAGSILDLTLPDSSVIYLNSGSSIKYAVEGNKGVREVYLNGEAWFHVNNVHDRPFIVHTDFYDVNVTGTSFNVKAYAEENYIHTTLEEGEVKITSTDDFKLAEDITLKPGEQAAFNKQSRELTIREVSTERYTSWKDNKLIFVNLSLKDLVLTLERRYGVDVEVKDESLLDLHFDGTIKNETIIEILDIIKSALHIEYNIVDQKIEITKSFITN